MSDMEHDTELANEVEDNAMVNSYYWYYRLAFLLIKLSFFQIGDDVLLTDNAR